MVKVVCPVCGREGVLQISGSNKRVIPTDMTLTVKDCSSNIRFMVTVRQQYNNRKAIFKL